MKRICVLLVAASAVVWPGLSAAQTPGPTLTLAPDCPIIDGQQGYGISYFLTGAPPNSPVPTEIRFPFGTDTGTFLTNAFGNIGPSQQGYFAPLDFVVMTMRLPDGTVLSQTLLRPCGPPITKADCKNSGWKAFDVFKNQGDCVSFVATGGRNQPSGP
jgi:hypothetical protein